MKINKKYIITSILMIQTLILAVFFTVKVNAADVDTSVVANEKTMVRMVTALVKGSDSVTTTNLQNGLNKYVGSGVATAGTKTGNVIPITFTATGNIYEIDINNGATFDDSSGGQVYTITYNANGGTGAPEVQTKIAGSAITLSTIKPTRIGYTFLGWSTNSSATTAEYASGAQFTTDANTTLYAVWVTAKVTLTLYSNGGTYSNGQEMIKASVDIGNTLQMPPATMNPTREGYNFLGYATNPTATVVQYTPGQLLTLNADLTLYAVWQANSGVAGTYTVTFNGSGGKIGTTALATNSTTLTYSLTTNISTIPTLYGTKTGYTFQGWSTSSSSTTIVYRAGDTFKGTSNMTLYAVWARTGTEIM